MTTKKFPGLPVHGGYGTELTPLDYFRLPRFLALAELPQHWGAVELRLMVFLIVKWNLVLPRGYSSIAIRDAKRFVGATKKQLQAAMKNLAEDAIIIREIDDDHLVIFTPGLNGRRREFTPQRVWQESFTLLEAAEINEKDEKIRWVFSSSLISRLATPADLGYGKVQFEAIRRLRRFDSLRLYMNACVSCGTWKERDRLWEPAQLARFLGYKHDIRSDNLKRSIAGAIAEIQDAGAFNDDHTRPVYTFDTTGRGHRLAMIKFEWSGNQRVHPTLWGKEADAAAERERERVAKEIREHKPSEREIEQELLKLVWEEKNRREYAREAWEAAKERIVDQKNQEFVDELYKKVMS